MAHEISDWKEGGCSLDLNVALLSNREPYSREINEAFGEGGGLNAGYDVVEAVAMAASEIGRWLGLEYGKDFVFKTRTIGAADGISFDFCDRETMNRAREVLRDVVLDPVSK